MFFDSKNGNQNNADKNNISNSLSRIEQDNSNNDNNEISISDPNDIFNYPSPKKMLSEISSSLNQYYLKSPYRRNKNNLIYNQKEYNSEQINNHQYNNKSKKIENIKNRIILNNKLGSNFTFKSDDIYTTNIINKNKNINRPKFII